MKRKGWLVFESGIEVKDITSKRSVAAACKKMRQRILNIANDLGGNEWDILDWLEVHNDKWFSDVPEVEEAKTSREVADHVAGQLAEAGWAGAKKEEQSAEDLWKLRMQKYNRLRTPTPDDLDKLGAALFLAGVVH